MLARWLRRIAAAWACVLTAVVGFMVASCTSEQREVNPDMPVKGIDVSAHNGNIDFEAVRGDGIDFVYIKATEGATFKDSAFHVNIRKAQEAGLRVGAYHFFRFETNGTMQALNLLNSVRGRHLDLPLVIDIEEWGNSEGCSTASVIGRVREMIDYLQSNGYSVVLYTNRDGYERFVEGHLDRYPLWICSFVDLESLKPKPNNLKLWQFTHRGKVNGVAGDVDRNVFMGSPEEFEGWLTEVPK